MSKSRAQMQPVVDAKVAELVTTLGAVDAADVGRLSRALVRSVVTLAYASGMPRSLPITLNFLGALSADVVRGLLRDHEVQGEKAPPSKGKPTLTLVHSTN